MLKPIEFNPYPDKIGFVAQYNAFGLGAEAQLEADRKAIFDRAIVPTIESTKGAYMIITLKPGEYHEIKEYQQLKGD